MNAENTVEDERDNLDDVRKLKLYTYVHCLIIQLGQWTDQRNCQSGYGSLTPAR